MQPLQATHVEVQVAHLPHWMWWVHARPARHYGTPLLSHTPTNQPVRLVAVQDWIWYNRPCLPVLYCSPIVILVGGGEADNVVAFEREGRGFKSYHHWSTPPLVGPLLSAGPISLIKEEDRRPDIRVRTSFIQTLSIITFLEVLLSSPGSELLHSLLTVRFLSSTSYFSTADACCLSVDIYAIISYSGCCSYFKKWQLVKWICGRLLWALHCISEIN